MKCIIIDDEPLALELLEDFISKVPFLELVGSCSNGFEATTILQAQKIDLIFTDIEMPDFSGIDFIKSLDNKPLFIFTTAYSHYAVEGFNLNAIDYLVKPIPFHRFLKAATRAQSLLKSKTEEETPVTNLETTPEFIFVKSEYENLKINLADIKYIESLKDYIKIHTHREKPILTLSSLKSFEEKLGRLNFIRVHKSYIVSIKHIYSVQRNRIIIDNNWIPIGLNYRDDFIKKIDN
ncbi:MULTISPECIES: LytTR family DNA-binding domain-containing protein [Polaribacter]|uniref:DNA-binding response regulator n=1 Tax=Polaribacter sejongensis TaxID=985043 RepID=A0AAJ1VHI6_9FLAO|nr:MULTISPECIES: LytTR family DNA-binding domain-containing protein [Polaribacter]AUC22449.1 DNA-binding response regulator [Polaribacter sejongensis]MDN3619422.1 LytTR family DNA-binding domain-containing protein [Polaribacter undariae]UWD33378.1 LytTR family DNA-binding domain-containing protein [Polaribacter undariae]